MVQYKGKKLHDNKWHTVLAEKQGSFIALTVDKDPPEMARFAGSDQNTDTGSVLYIGGLPPSMIFSYHYKLMFNVSCFRKQNT